MEVNDQFHTPAVLCRVKEIPIPIEQEGGSVSDVEVKRNISVPTGNRTSLVIFCTCDSE